MPGCPRCPSRWCRCWISRARACWPNSWRARPVLELLEAPYDALHDMRTLGGPVVNWIFLACVLMWSIVLERYWYFSRTLKLDTASALASWQARADKFTWSSRQIRDAMISRLNAAMSARLGVLRVLVPMCPLLGLLGTVSGMLSVFDAMA